MLIMAQMQQQCDSVQRRSNRQGLIDCAELGADADAKEIFAVQVNAGHSTEDSIPVGFGAALWGLNTGYLGML